MADSVRCLPIPFTAPMVRAVLAGTKTQTRRLVRPQPPAGAESVIRPFADERRQWAADDPHDIEQGRLLLGDVPRCPYGQPGDKLWVREAWRADVAFDPVPPRDLNPRFAAIGYEAGGTTLQLKTPGKRRPGMFMPRWASRITLEVTGVRLERLQDISEADAQAEGVERDSDGWRDYLMPQTQCCVFAYGSYQTLWESINGHGSCGANPWVWVVEFRRVEAKLLGAA